MPEFMCFFDGALRETIMNDNSRFSTFTDRAKHVLELAQEESAFFQHHYLGTEHVLLGLSREGGGTAAKVLSSLGLTLDQLHVATEELVGRGPEGDRVEIQMTLDAKRVVDMAISEAKRMDSDSVDTEHLLLGLLQVTECDAMQILQSFDVPLEKVRVRAQQFTNFKKSFRLKHPSGLGIASGDITITPQARVTTEHVRFDKFTERARKVLSLAQEEAQRFQHNYIGTEHLLLGLVREGEGVAAKVLENMGVQLADIRKAVEFIIGRGDRIVLGEIGLTPRAKKVIELAVDEARRLNHHFIGTEHLLLGLVREGEGIAAGVLESLGVNLERVRTNTILVLSATGTTTASVSHSYQARRTRTEEATSEEVRKQLQDIALTPMAEQVLVFAQSCSHTFQHGYVGTEHLLYGLTRVSDELTNQVLNDQGVTYAQVVSALNSTLGHGINTWHGTVPLTPRVQEIFHLASDLTKQRTQPAVGPEHILWGLLAINDGNANDIFTQLHVNVEDIRTKLQAAMDGGGHEDE
jgi:ATP-dependent Clp protease ATP-binding subunit ClpA